MLPPRQGFALSYTPNAQFVGKEQFSNSPDFDNELMNAIIDALTAHSTMSKQALDSEKVRCGLKDILLGPAKLYEGRYASVETGLDRNRDDLAGNLHLS